MLDAKTARDLVIRHGLSQKTAEAFVGMIHEVQADAIRECAKAIKHLTLPPEYRWGDDALQTFRDTCSIGTAAILALLPNEPQG